MSPTWPWLAPPWRPASRNAAGGGGGDAGGGGGSAGGGGSDERRFPFRQPVALGTVTIQASNMGDFPVPGFTSAWLSLADYSPPP